MRVRNIERVERPLTGTWAPALDISSEGLLFSVVRLEIQVDLESTTEQHTDGEERDGLGNTDRVKAGCHHVGSCV